MGRATQEASVATVEQPRAVAKRIDPEAFRRQLVERLPDLLPDHTTPERFVAVTMQALAREPSLYECQPMSVLMAALEVAQVGLEPTGSIGGAHLVPFREKDGTKKAQVIYDYRGLQHLIRQGGGGEVKAVLVYAGDEFAVYEGTHPRIEHVPRYLTRDPESITFVYAWPLDHPEKFEVMTKADVDLIRASSKLKNGVPWTQHYGQQARKTAIRRLANYLDLRPETRSRIEQDVEREYGRNEAPTATASRSTRLKDRLLAAGPVDAPGAAATPEADDQSPPSESASQPTENAAVADDPGPGETPEERAAASGTTWQAPDEGLFREVKQQ